MAYVCVSLELQWNHNAWIDASNRIDIITPFVAVPNEWLPNKILLRSESLNHFLRSIVSWLASHSLAVGACVCVFYGRTQQRIQFGRHWAHVCMWLIVGFMRVHRQISGSQEINQFNVEAASQVISWIHFHCDNEFYMVENCTIVNLIFGTLWHYEKLNGKVWMSQSRWNAGAPANGLNGFNLLCADLAGSTPVNMFTIRRTWKAVCERKRTAENQIETKNWKIKPPGYSIKDKIKILQQQL